MAGLPEDLESAEVIEKRWKQDGLTVFKSRYNVLLSYPDENNPNRHVLLTSYDWLTFSYSLIVLCSE